MHKVPDIKAVAMNDATTFAALYHAGSYLQPLLLALIAASSAHSKQATV